MSNIKVKKKAFMLTEIAVCIAIIGILLSLIVTGAGYIENGKNQAFIYEVTAINQNINKFYNLYNKVPGDFHLASSTISTTLINGNGNTLYENPIPSTTIYESLLAWKHLQAAGMIFDQYTGTPGAAPNISILGTNIPKSKVFKNGGYRIGSDIPPEVSANLDMLQYRIILEYANYTTQTTTGRGTTSALKPSNMQQIDYKMDDGKPKSGFVYGTNATCYTATTPAIYVNSSAESCIFSWVLNQY